MEDGYSERAAVKKLGDPKQLAYEAAGIPTEVRVLVNLMAMDHFVSPGISIMGQFGTRSISYTLSIDIVIWCIPFTGAC
ncbi:hypothetical protein [Enterococcus avium]|uniref:hypothetical protein n=1 Tax=Enterococcus avium TaxID=33945 RepID=UPI001D0E030A|nr:hypothetical protein [Enterococcus avium]